MKFILGLMMAPMILSAQLVEDIFQEGKFIYMPVESNHWEDRIVDNYSYIYHYAKLQLKVSDKLKDESKTTSIYLYHKGQSDAYKDVLKFMDNLPPEN